MKVLCAVLIVLAFATMAGASDINFGSYARFIGMGGAGLAFTDDATTASVINPAAGAAGGRNFQFVFPSFDLSTTGASLGDLRSRTSEVSSTDTTDAIQLAEDFGKQRTTLNIGFVTGFTGRFGVTAEGEAQGIINPAAAFQAWVNAGHPTTVTGLVAAGLIPTASASDVSTYASSLADSATVTGQYVYSLPAVSYGRGFGTRNGTLWVGTKMRLLHSDVRTWNIGATASGTDLSLAATEQPRQKDNGFGADLGFVLQPRNSIVQFGLVVNNAIDAGLAGMSTPIMYSAGIASQPNARFRYAVDLVNINKAYSQNTLLRMGGEWNITNKFALRGGYTGSGFAWGVQVAGLNFAFSNKAPSMISRMLSF
ncbi:MAG: conjugal transfer protein TraF [Armatimonadetes bacterium]|nr:conjugal transfer protein TraF [Armatimonadota bacterium]